MSDPSPPNIEELKQTVTAAIREHWKAFLLQGVLLVILGLLAVAQPHLSTLAVEIFVGWLFLVGGIFRGLTLLRSRSVPGFAWALVTAVLAIILGAMLLLRPHEGVLSLTMLLVAFFILEGIAMILIAIQFRGNLPNWSWTLISGAVDLVLAYLIWRGWPSTAEWAIGLLVGINLFFVGVSLVMTALAARGAGTDGPA